jgi:hypothetical protein
VSWLIAEKLESNEEMLSPAGTVALPPDDDAPEDEGELLLPQAAATAATPSTAPHRVARAVLPEPITVIPIAWSSWSAC